MDWTTRIYSATGGFSDVSFDSESELMDYLGNHMGEWTEARVLNPPPWFEPHITSEEF